MPVKSASTVVLTCLVCAGAALRAPDAAVVAVSADITLGAPLLPAVLAVAGPPAWATATLGARATMYSTGKGTQPFEV